MSSAHHTPAELCVTRPELAKDATAKKFEQAGLLQIRDFLPKTKIAALSKEVASAYNKQCNNGRSVNVGPKRVMFPIPIEGLFNDHELYANSNLSQFLSNVLGPQYLLSCYTSIIALPNAPKQHRHRDYPGLFGSNIDYFAPSFAINLFIPLVSLNKDNGTTRVWLSSHRKPAVDEAIDDEYIDPIAQQGDAVLMDYRLLHEGTPNNSPAARPLLCIGYCRNWFHDAVNAPNFNPLQIDASNFERLLPEQQALLTRAQLFKDHSSS